MIGLVFAGSASAQLYTYPDIALCCGGSDYPGPPYDLITDPPPGQYSFGLLPPSDHSNRDANNFHRPWGTFGRQFRLECHGPYGFLGSSVRVPGVRIFISLVRRKDTYTDDTFVHKHAVAGGPVTSTVGSFQEGNEVITGPDGYAWVMYDTPEASGIVDGVLRCENGGELSFSIGIGVRGLVAIPLPTDKKRSYKFTNANTLHPYEVPYGVPELNAAVRTVADKFFEETGLQLPINDISLPYGGMFDLNGNWERGYHQWHRLGIDVDINLHDDDERPEDREPRRMLLGWCKNSHLKRYVEYKRNGTLVTNHVHFIYDPTGKDYDFE